MQQPQTYYELIIYLVDKSVEIGAIVYPAIWGALGLKAILNV